MKNLRTSMDNWFDRLDNRWSALSIKTQHKYLLLFFLGYLLLTVGVVLKVWYDAGTSKHGVAIEHIENPVIKMKESATSVQDSLSLILKSRMYERK